MSLIIYLVILLLAGLIVGALGRLAIPGRDPMTIPQTILLGVVSSFVAGLIGALLFGRGGGGLLLAVAVAAAIVYLVRRMRGDRTPPVYGRRR